jgi:hypothetical protein
MNFKSLLKRSLFFLVITIFLFSCHKYEEGPSLSLRTKNARLKGFWVSERDQRKAYIKQYINEDGTKTYYYIFNPFGFEYSKPENPIDSINHRVYYDIYYFRDNNNLSKIGRFDFFSGFENIQPDQIWEHVQEIKIKGSDTTFYVGTNTKDYQGIDPETGDWNWIDGKASLTLTFGKNSEKWDILRLTDNELVVERDPNGKKTFKKLKFKNEKDVISFFNL